MTSIRYLMDTNAASHLALSRFPVMNQRFVAAGISHVAISAVTEGEILYGLSLKPEAKTLAGVMHQFLRQMRILPWDSQVANAYGPMRAALHRSGRPLGNLDMMIAAHAMAENAVLVTNDAAFSRVRGLRVEDWTV